jgi:flagellar biosynthesis protein
MSQYKHFRAAALKYDSNDSAPVVVASGAGYVADKIIETAQNNNVPVYQDNSLATLLSQLKCGTEIPKEMFQAIVDIYLFFLNYLPEEKTEETED